MKRNLLMFQGDLLIGYELLSSSQSLSKGQPINGTEIDGGVLAPSCPSHIGGIGSSQFDIYSNPITNMLQIEAIGRHSMVIYNASGCLMNHYIFANKIEIDTSDYPRGSYTVKLDGAVCQLTID